MITIRQRLRISIVHGSTHTHTIFVDSVVFGRHRRSQWCWWLSFSRNGGYLSFEIVTTLNRHHHHSGAWTRRWTDPETESGKNGTIKINGAASECECECVTHSANDETSSASSNEGSKICSFFFKEDWTQFFFGSHRWKMSVCCAFHAMRYKSNWDLFCFDECPLLLLLVVCTVRIQCVFLFQFTWKRHHLDPDVCILDNNYACSKKCVRTKGGRKNNQIQWLCDII